MADVPSGPTPKVDGDPTGGIVCAKCGCRHFYTTNTYRRRRGIERRRVCRNCRFPVRTMEIYVNDLDLLKREAREDLSNKINQMKKLLDDD